MALPIPNLILNHDKFDKWYPGQEIALESIMRWLQGDKRFLCASMPTGSGKSLLAVLSSVLGSKRTAVLTVTKGLQGQMAQDFARSGMIDIRGQNNYLCNLIQDGNTTVDDGPCHAGVQCEVRHTCSYYSKLDQAKHSQMLVTNYSYYLAQTLYGKDGLQEAKDSNPIQLLICDEAHLAFQALESFVAIYLTNAEITALGTSFPKDVTWEAWQQWADDTVYRAEREYNKAKQEIVDRSEDGGKIPGVMLRKVKHYSSLINRLKSLSTAEGRWIYATKPNGMTFNPVWPGEHSYLLFQQTPKILVMSATFSEKTADSLNIPKEEREWLEMPSYFPASNSPIVQIKSTRMNHRATSEDLKLWVTRIDQLINKRKDRKGIIFTVSYERRNYLMANSQHVNIMHTHGNTDVYAAVERFKKAAPPAVLVSPTVTSGWDFPGDTCLYGIIGKIPYPDTRDLVVKARCEDDKDWGAYLAMQTLVQECGRGTRSAEDKCEYLICDDNWSWFWRQYKHFSPDWFQKRVKKGVVEVIPEPYI